jgi:hypothetical protein
MAIVEAECAECRWGHRSTAEDGSQLVDASQQGHVCRQLRPLRIKPDVVLQADADAAAAAVTTGTATQAQAQQQQAYANDVAAAAAQAAQAAMEAWMATHGGPSNGGGGAPSPSMVVTPIVDPTQATPSWTVTDERKRWYKWGAIGAGALGIGLLAALLARR